MFEKYVSILLIGILYYSFLEYKKHILVKKIIIHMVVISAIQILWTVAQLLPIYLYDTFISNIFYLIAGCLTILLIYKEVAKIGYWLLTSFMIAPILTFLWLQINNEPFEGILFGGMKEGLTLIFAPFINALFQIGIWWFVKFYKWLGQGE